MANALQNQISVTLDRFRMKVRSLCLDEASSSSGPWWKAIVLVKVKLLAWGACQHSLHTRDRLASRGACKLVLPEAQCWHLKTHHVKADDLKLILWLDCQMTYFTLQPITLHIFCCSGSRLQKSVQVMRQRDKSMFAPICSSEIHKLLVHITDIIVPPKNPTWNMSNIACRQNPKVHKRCFSLWI